LFRTNYNNSAAQPKAAKSANKGGANMNIYSKKEIEEALENDEINAQEEGFMLGYCNS